jgi:predicted AlkP superfamily phosphohydrolase/phosphomutase
MTATKVLVIALDACDPQTVRSMAAAGELPTLARLLEEGATATSRNPYGLFVGSLWSSFFTARSAARTGFHCWEEIDRLTYEQRLTTAMDVRGTPFWETLSDAGRRVAIIDVPHSRVNTPVNGSFNGIVVCEYGCHDRHFGFHTWPPPLAKELEQRFGLHPIMTVDPYEVKEFAPDDYIHRAGPHRTPEENRALLAGMLDGIDRKTQLSTHLLAMGGWDLFLTVFGESHATGHQQWHLHDPSHPWHDPAVAAQLGDPLATVYRSLDAAVAEHLAMTGDDTTVFVLLSHGMGPHYDGTHLLHEILRLLDGAEVGGTRLMRAAKRTWSLAPGPVRRLVLPGALALLRRRLARNPLPPVRDDATPEERAAQRFFLSPNNFVFGGVRINVVGREPQGKVRPGAEYDAVCAQLTEDLLALVNLETGGPVVREVARTDEHYEREPDDALPDLLIDWAHDAPVNTAWSPKTGVVHGPYTHWRTGDHRPDGLLLATGPGIPSGAVMPTVDMVDFGASLSARLGVDLGDDVDGRPVPWCAGAGTDVTVGASPAR